MILMITEAIEFLKKNTVNRYVIREDEIVDVDDSVDIFTQQSKLPAKFGRVNGFFDCDNTNLASLEGVPSYVNGYFSCEHIRLTSLHDVHKHIKEIRGKFYCRGNNIRDSVLGLLMIKGITEVTLDNKEVQDILNKYLGRGRAGIFDAQQEFFDSGLDEYARL